MEPNSNNDSIHDEAVNDNETKKFVHNKISIKKNQLKTNLVKKNKNTIIFFIIIIIIFLIIFFYFIIKNKTTKINYINQDNNIKINEQKKPKEKIEEIISTKNIKPIKHPYSTKWVVLTTVNPPNRNIKKLLKIMEPWKIVVIGDIKTNNASWDIYKNHTRIIYLSLEDQIKLGYNITKYIPMNSYTRKNIGYLYAIEHGATEIYETDDNYYIFSFYHLNYYQKEYTCYAENDNSVMVNPYSFYGKATVWPRGYRLKDLDKKSETKFYRLLTRNKELNHLIYQGLINMEPDVDSIYRQTRSSKNFLTNQIFFFNINLMYLPGNFIPINSKNTRYLYDIFPALPLPTTVPKRVSDIWRGYLMQRYAWIYNGTVVFHSASVDDKSKIDKYNVTKDFIEERDLFFKLDKVLDSLNVNMDSRIKIPSDFLIDLIELFVEEGILGENDLDMYRAFMDDLDSFGYKYNFKFDNTIQRNHKQLLNIYSEFHFYFARQNKIILQNNNRKKIKVFKHQDPKTKYDDILLIINYNYEFLTKLNDYILSLYHEYFPHMIFMYPGQIDNNATYVSCPESRHGYYSYVCIKRVYELYPNKKGYLFLMDDNFLKVWELENLDFNIPWFYHFFVRHDNFDKGSYVKAKILLDIHLDWKRRYRKFLGSTTVAYAVSDIYYIPQKDIANFCSMVTTMYEKKIFLETAVPTMMGIMLKERYQIIQFAGLWGDARNTTLKYLRSAEKQVTIHPIKFSSKILQAHVTKYIFIMNARDY